MLVEQINLENGSAIGLKMDMEHAPLLVIRAKKGFVMCGYLNIEVANKLGDAAVRVTGVRTFEDVLNAKAVDLGGRRIRSEEHTSELQSRLHLVCRLLLEKKKSSSSSSSAATVRLVRARCA